MGHHVYFDNYYNSPELIDLLYKRKMHACGTVRKNQKSQKVKKPQPVFLYNRYMSGVDLTDQFLQYYSFLHKSVKWSKKFFVHCLNMVILNAHILHKKYSDSKIMHWQFRIQLVKHMLSNAQQQPWEIVPVPDLVDCHLCLVEKHFIEPIPGQEGGRRNHPSHACFVCHVSKEALSDAGFGEVTNPKSTPLTGVQYVSMHCVFILVLGYITLKRTTQVK